MDELLRAAPVQPLRTRVRRHQRLLAVVLFLLVLLALFQLSGIRDHLSLGYVHSQLVAHPVTGLLLFVLLFCLGNLIQLPGWIFLAAAVLALGQWAGGVATYVAACVSCGVTYVLIRWLGGDALRKLEGPLAARLLVHLDARPVLAVVLLRTLFQTLPALNYALSMSGLRFRNYALGTVLGLPLPIALYCYFFEALARALNIH